MKITSLVTTSILLALSLFASSKNRKEYKINTIYSISDSSINAQRVKVSVYKVILSGKEDKIKNFFKNIPFDELVKSDSGAIVKAFKKLNTNDKVSRAIWILEEVKKRNSEIKTYVYNELLKVEYGKPSILLNHMINNYFVSFNESDSTLFERVRKLQRKMNR